MNRTLSAIAIGALSLVSSHAAAQNVDMRFLGTGAGKDIKIWSDGYDGRVFAGQLIHEIRDDRDSLSGVYTTFCVDVHQFVSSRYKTYRVSNLTDVPDAHPMSDAAAQAINDIYAYAGDVQLSDSVSDTFAAAFQIALWEIVEDFDAREGVASLDINRGSFKAKKTNGWRLTGDIVDYINGLFGAIGNGSRDQGLIALKSRHYQDQVIKVVPAPMTLAGFGAIGLAATRRRRRA
ncbi:MAG: Cys-Gln thioester bond-forming surface protein [Phycisphaerales bacterium JB059]